MEEINSLENVTSPPVLNNLEIPPSPKKETQSEVSTQLGDNQT